MGRHYKKAPWINTHKIFPAHVLTHTEGLCQKDDQSICPGMASSCNTELKQNKNSCLGSQHVFLLQAAVENQVKN